MIDEHEIIWMWAEYGGALFWDKEKGCLGNCYELITVGQHKIINLIGIEGMAGWYARFNNEKHPAFEWTSEEYAEWIEEGWKYARAVRRILPDDIDLYYQYDENGIPYSVLRENAVDKTHPVISTERLIREAEHFILSSYNRTLDPTPYVDFIIALCKACPCEELIAGTHCWWSREEKELRIQWYNENLDCHIKVRPKTYRDEETWMAQWTIGRKYATNQENMPEVSGISSSFYFDGDSICLNSLFQYLSWLIIDRGLDRNGNAGINKSIMTDKDMIRPIEDYLDPRWRDLAEHPEKVGDLDQLTQTAYGDALTRALEKQLEDYYRKKESMGPKKTDKRNE